MEPIAVLSHALCWQRIGEPLSVSRHGVVFPAKIDSVRDTQTGHVREERCQRQCLRYARRERGGR